MYPMFESSLSKPYPIGWHIPLLPWPFPHTRTHPCHLLKRSTQWFSYAEQGPMWAPGWNIKASSFSFLLSYKRKEPKRMWLEFFQGNALFCLIDNSPPMRAGELGKRSRDNNLSNEHEQVNVVKSFQRLARTSLFNRFLSRELHVLLLGY